MRIGLSIMEPDPYASPQTSLDHLEPPRPPDQLWYLLLATRVWMIAFGILGLVVSASILLFAVTAEATPAARASLVSIAASVAIPAGTLIRTTFAITDLAGTRTMEGLVEVMRCYRAFWRTSGLVVFSVIAVHALVLLVVVIFAVRVP